MPKPASADPSPSDQSHAEAPSSADVELAMLAKAVGHPARVQIIRFLLSRDSCMCGDIVQHLPLAQSTVSQHLKMLKDAGLIRGTIDGPRVCYCIEPVTLKRFLQLLSGLHPLSSCCETIGDSLKEGGSPP